MIPFYEQRLRFIVDEIHEMQQPGQKRSELSFLKDTRIEVEEKLKEEKATIQGMTDKMYQTWKDIEDLR
jgi:hypothetical protein